MLDFDQLLNVSRISCKESISSKKRALETLSALLTPDADEHTHMEILDALSARERLGSTGLGHGIALPHGRMPNLRSPVAAVITLEGGIDFESSDDEAVDILFGLLMPQQCDEEHLQILAKLAKLFIQEDIRNDLRNSVNNVELMQIFAKSSIQ